MLFAGQDLIIHNSLPEYTVDGTEEGAPLDEADGGLPVPTAEISVEYEGAIRGEAPTRCVDRFGTRGLCHRTDPLGALFRIILLRPHYLPSSMALPLCRRTRKKQRAHLIEFQETLKAIRSTVAPQATVFPGIIDIEAVDVGGSSV